jgi:lysozyme
MAWTRAQIEKSLDGWRDKETRYRLNWKSKKKGDPRRFYWFKLLKKAVKNVDYREEQLRALGVGGVSDAGVALVKQFEGFRSKPYQDAVGVWTIGYGETRGISRWTRPWTEKQAAEALRRRLDRDYFPAVRRLHAFPKLNQHQVDALTSFAYNLGAGIFHAGGSIGDALRSRDWRSATARAILLYDKAGSPAHALPGLTSRRHAERDLFLKS